MGQKITLDFAFPSMVTYTSDRRCGKLKALTIAKSDIQNQNNLRRFARMSESAELETRPWKPWEEVSRGTNACRGLGGSQGETAVVANGPITFLRSLYGF